MLEQFRFATLTATMMLNLAGAAAFGQVKVVVDHNDNAAARPAFKFKDVPPPVKDDAGGRAKLSIVDGEMDGNGGDLGVLTDGLVPDAEDQPAANFFFNAGTMGGRFTMDLGRMIEIAAINTYSWHPNTRGPQVYKLYAADGADPKFNASPAGTLDPATCGWKLLTVVDTRPKQGEGGGQYGVAITGEGGPLGRYRYLLFACVATEADDDYGNTFYSEVDVIARTKW